MARRIGREDSETREILMDAVETVMRAMGYAALSARSVARQANLNYQLIFYYFGSLDRLFLATYERRAKRNLDQVRKALRSERPLHALWSISSDPEDAALSLEYMAMANHLPAIRDETLRLVTRTRQLIKEELAGQLDLAHLDSDTFTPDAVGMAVLNLGINYGIHSAQGLSDILRDITGVVEWCLSKLEPAS